MSELFQSMGEGHVVLGKVKQNKGKEELNCVKRLTVLNRLLLLDQ